MVHEKKVCQNFKKNYGLSNETSLERIGRDLFVSRFYTKTVQKAEKYRFSNSSKQKKSTHYIKIPKIRAHLRLTIYLCDYFKVRKHWLKVE
jgi:uncharacterized protein (DUF362 family)